MGPIVVPRSAQWDRLVPGRGGADVGVPLNDSTTIEIPLKQKGWSNRGQLVVPRSAEWDRVVPGRGGADIGVPLHDSTTIVGVP